MLIGEIQGMVDKMSVGEQLDVYGRAFRAEFPCGFPSIYGTAEESFLSKQVGSAWGCVTVEHLWPDDIYRIRRNEGSERRVYVDPDRRHLYRTGLDGTLEFIEPR